MLQVDNSTLKAVAACHTQATLRYGTGWEAAIARPELEAGKAWHAALEAYFVGQTAASATATFVQAYAAAADVDPTGPKARLHLSNLRPIVENWFTLHPRETFPLQVHAVEQPFCVRLTDEIEYVGIFDALGVDAQGRPWILEHKSTGRLSEDWWDQFHLDSQLSGYVWARREQGVPAIGAYVNAVEFSKLPSSPVIKCKVHGVKYAECGVLHAEMVIRPITRTAEQLAQWKMSAIRLAQIWQGLIQQPDVAPPAMQGQFNGSCKFCQYQTYCRLGRPDGHLKANFQMSKWEPLKRGHQANV
jgi:hypothetical protein